MNIIDYKEVIKSLTKKQREVFDQICVNGYSSSIHSMSICSPLELKKLLDWNQLDIMSGFFTVNHDAYIAWCELCAEECGVEV